ncbi:MAG: MFS transporter [Afipia sp.]|nr:MFS transporter [Afipia sp.]
MKAAFTNRDYRLLFIGQSISHLGDQFHLIALPWLVLTLTHDPLQLGAVLAVAGIPRALLMLVGGATADRHSPRLIMLASDALRFVLTAALAAAILTGQAQLWMVYVLALAFGIVSGFFMPAAEATVPRLLESDQLEAGNAAMMGADQLASFVGPILAGLIIAAFGAGADMVGAQAASLFGIGVAFAVDALSFSASALALAFMRRIPAANADARTHPLADLVEGARYTWSSAHLRAMIIVIGVANFLIMGPMFVGLPVIAQGRLTGGAAAYGIIMAAAGVGSLIGMIAAGALPKPSDRLFAWLAVALFAGFGLAVGALGFVHATWIAASLMFVTGLGNGYIAVIAMTSLQRRTAEQFMGRVMSFVMLAMVGLAPVSQAISGAVIRISPAALFGCAGLGFLLLAGWTATVRDVWVFVDGVREDSATAAPPGVGPVLV